MAILEDGEFDTSPGRVHVWDWRTPDNQRTRQWREEGEVYETSKTEEEIWRAYKAGKIRTISQLLQFISSPSEERCEGEAVAGRILEWERIEGTEIQLIKPWKGNGYYVQIIESDGAITRYTNTRFETLVEAERAFKEEISKHEF